MPQKNHDRIVFLHDDPDCPIRRLASEVGSKWQMLTVFALSCGAVRHNQLLERIEGISPKMLSSTLRSLQRDGFVDRLAYPEVPPRVEYSLTPMGQGLLEHLNKLVQWNHSQLEQIKAAQDAFDAEQAKIRIA